MPTSTDLVERSGDLKAALVAYGQGRRFARHLDKALDQYLAGRLTVEDADIANAMDRFLLQYRLPDGKTVVETFVEEHIDLSDEERTLLFGWHDAVEGLFHIDGRDGDALVMTNLIDDLKYRVYSNVGPAALTRMKKGSFLATRLVPIEDEWLLSGISSIYRAEHRDEVYRAAAETAIKHPELVFRNPERLAQAWEMQREERQSFVDFFGTDLVVLPGREVEERLRAYMHYRMHDVRDADGKSASDRAREAYGAERPELDFGLGTNLTDADTVGVLYDEVEGMMFFRNFGIVEEAFADPDTVTDQRHTDAVLDYLRDETIPPVIFQRLADRDPERASRLFARALNRPGFSWGSDGETLLRQYKAEHFERTPLPTVAPVSPTLARAQLTRPAPNATARSRHQPRPAKRPQRRVKRRGR